MDLASAADVRRRTVVEGRNDVTGWADELVVDGWTVRVEHSSQSGSSDGGAAVFSADAISAQGLVVTAALGGWAVGGLVGA